MKKIKIDDKINKSNNKKQNMYHVKLFNQVRFLHN